MIPVISPTEVLKEVAPLPELVGLAVAVFADCDISEGCEPSEKDERQTRVEMQTKNASKRPDKSM